MSHHSTTGPAVALAKCFYCLEAGEIIIQTRNILRPDPRVERMHDKVCSMSPCSKCAGYMKQGVILITIDEGKSAPDWNKAQMPNPYRTGGFFVVKDEAVKRMLPKNADL